MPNETVKGDPSRRSVLALGWVSFLTDVSSDMIYPLLPAFLTKTLGAGPAAVGLIEGVAETTASLTKIGSGIWSDRVRRRKPIVVLGYAIAAVVRPLVAFAQLWSQVLAIRFTDRVGKGIRTSPRDALLADIVPSGRRGRAFGLQRAMDNAGAVVGPLVAAGLLKLAIVDERGVFLLAAVPAFAAILVLLLAVPDTPRRPDPPPVAAAPGESCPRPSGRCRHLRFFTSRTRPTRFSSAGAGRGRGAVAAAPLWSFLHAVKSATGVPAARSPTGRDGFPRSRSGGSSTAPLRGFAFVSGPLAVWALFAFYGLFFG